MKAIIFKRHTISGNIHRTAIYVFGICIYQTERPMRGESTPRTVGFVQFPNDAPGFIDDEDYFTDE